MGMSVNDTRSGFVQALGMLMVCCELRTSIGRLNKSPAVVGLRDGCDTSLFDAPVMLL